jgi:putative Holliday junction resolvase
MYSDPMNEFHLGDHHPLHLKVIMSLDYGDKYIGVATYCVNRDPYPTPYGRIANKGEDYILNEIKKLISDECVDIVVMGLPYLLDGKATPQTQKLEAFTQRLSSFLQLPVQTQDETLSTYEAESRMKNSPQYNFQVDYSQIDAVAASVILEDFIRTTKKNSSL